jgi:hypothetical protein
MKGSKTSLHDIFENNNEGNKMNKYCVIILIILIPSVCCGATYYADHSGGSDTNNGMSTTNPWKHVPGMSGCSGTCATTNALPGDTFVFKGGETWTLHGADTSILIVPTSGTAGNKITYMSGQRLEIPWGTDHPVFDGGGVAGAKVIYAITARSNITIDGIKVINAGYSVDGSGNGIFMAGGSNVEIRNCLLDTNAVNALAFSTSIAGNGFYFHHNTIRNSGRIHILIGNATYDDIRIYNNLHEGLGNYDPKSYHGDGFMIGADNTTTYGITNLRIFNNKFYGNWSSGATAAIYLNGTGNDGSALYSTKDVYIYNNVIAFENNTCASPPFSPGAITVYSGRHSNVNILNNTISGDACTTNAITGIFLALVVNANVKNNIISGVDNAVIISSAATGTITVDSNLFNTVYGNHLIWDERKSSRYDTCAAAWAAGFGTTYCASADPKFTMIPSGGVTGSGNWTIRANSPAKGNGANLGAYFNTDLRGTPRPPGAAWDIGAYQYGSTSLGAPSNFRKMGQ